jgi:excisionase family DNA binding protein
VSIISLAEALPLLTLKEVAARLRMCPRSIQRKIAEGSFPAPIRIGRSVRFLESELEAYVNALKAARPTPPSS